MSSWLTEKRLENWMHVLWGLMLFTMPVTSFRWLPDVMGKTHVRPLAFYPMALAVVVLAVYLWKTKSFRWPAQTAPLVGFLLVALVSTLIGGFYAPPDLRGKAYWAWALRAWISLGIGMGFFWVSVYLSRSEDFLRKSLPWLYAGLGITIVWGVLQAIALNTSLVDLELINKIQLSFSIRGLTRPRISGFAYEPSWLADQITIFYFPWLFASLVTRVRITKYRWLEPALALGAIGILLLSYSRSGVIGLVFSVAVALLTVGRGLLVSIWSWFWGPFVSPEIPGRWNRVLILLLVILALVSAFLWLDRFQYFANLWEASLSNGLVDYVRAIAAAPRVAYIQAGMNIFNLHPWFGVGLGGSSFYLFDHLPSWALTDPYEIAMQFSPTSNEIPNVRNLIIRLLSETGIVGFCFYLAFNISVLGSIRKMFLSRKKLMVFASVAGLTAWPAIILRQFTLSTLTAPVIWVTLGMVVGYAHHVIDSPGNTEKTKE
ncbi:MAG: O-antigen ligase family protein [Anaerolineales bacterium]|nr:O-antigen ligase family protein [Anaerolineales bacterium]